MNIRKLLYMKQSIDSATALMEALAQDDTQPRLVWQVARGALCCVKDVKHILHEAIDRKVK